MVTKITQKRRTYWCGRMTKHLEPFYRENLFRKSKKPNNCFRDVIPRVCYFISFLFALPSVARSVIAWWLSLALEGFLITLPDVLWIGNRVIDSHWLKDARVFFLCIYLIPFAWVLFEGSPKLHGLGSEKNDTGLNENILNEVNWLECGGI